MSRACSKVLGFRGARDAQEHVAGDVDEHQAREGTDPQRLEGPGVRVVDQGLDGPLGVSAGANRYTTFSSRMGAPRSMRS